VFAFGLERRFTVEVNNDDSRDLLAEYAQTGCERAFRKLVDCYVNLVYSTARRLVNGDAHLAEDVTQTVFIDLARKARGLSKNVMLGGWLHRRTFNVATTLRRSQQRRQERERKSVEMNASQQPADPGIEEIIPMLDEAINRLDADDRAAIVMRFFEQRGFRELGQALGSGEDAARMRVNRALEKLQQLLHRQGVTLSATALGASLTAGAVTAAPVGLSSTIAGTALATSAAAAGIGGTILKLVTMANVKSGIVFTAVVIAVATPIALQRQSNLNLRKENQSLRQQVAQLNALAAENERLSNLLNRKASTPRLPAPSIPATASQPPSNETLSGTNLIAHILKSDKAPQLQTQQLESYLKENRRSAGSLLAAFRATSDQSLLQEAIAKFPDDPHVAFTAAYRLEGGDRQYWLEVFKKSAPDNSLANYLSAGEYFKSGQADKAVEELVTASSKPHLTDYTMEFGQNDEEAWRAAGYSVAEAKTIGASSLLLPQLAETKQLAHQMVNLARAYEQAGDSSSAELTLRMAIELGQRLDQNAGTPLITKLVGRAVQGIALSNMDPTAPYGAGSQTVRQRLDELTRQRTRITEITRHFDELTPRLTEQDWISYRDRWRIFGEEEALQWMISKYGQP
jgi:RNA polymerase sigma factor (sigma-70 family)